MSRVVAVVGTGYSGSTLLAFLLNAHPEIASVSEATGPYDLWEDQSKYPCSCGRTLSECDFWRRVSQEMKTRGFAFGPGRWDLRFRISTHPVGYQLLTQSLRSNALDAARDRLVMSVPAWRDYLEEKARRNEAFVESVLAVTGKSVFLDASKPAARIRYFHRLTSFDLRVIHLVRDSLGFVDSWTSRGNSLSSGIRYWTRTAGHARRLEALIPPERFLRVRYEDLCRDTEGETARIARFAGLEPRSGSVRFRETEHHMIGGEMRLESSSDVGLDERWRERLSPSQRQTIERWTGRDRRRLGYA